jgi:hypothetical protein
MNFAKRAFGILLLGAALGMSLVAIGPRLAGAVEVGEPAPEFKLPSTTGGDISLRDFRGKKFVLLEFYGSNFSPT